MITPLETPASARTDRGHGRLVGVDMAERICTLPDCSSPHLARGYCTRHYGQARRRGLVEPLPPPDHDALFWAKVDRRGPDDCWPWLAARNAKGYGVSSYRGAGTRQAHRISYQLLVGPISGGLEIDHLCRNKCCVNPRHLEPVTAAENMRRMVEGREVEDPGWRFRVRKPIHRKPRPPKTECKRGHPFDEANTCLRPNGTRKCKACNREAEQRRRDRPHDRAAS